MQHCRFFKLILMSRNPFAPPPTEPIEAAKAGRYVLANRWRRLVNFVVDQLCFGFVASLLMAIVAVVVGRDVDSLVDADWKVYTFLIAASLLYYVSCESIAGRTLGKLLTGTRTVAVSGERPSFEQILLRTLVRLVVPFEFLSFLRHDAVGFHDRWSGTRVVRN